MKAPRIRAFKGGATRDGHGNKYDYEAFTNALVKRRFAKFMHFHRRQKDGSLRDGDNWQRGMPREVFMKSLIRHVEQLHYQWDKRRQLSETTLCAIRFNADGLLHELLLGRDIKE